MTSTEITAMLDGQPAQGPGTTDNSGAGSADCLWATAGGANNSIEVLARGSFTGCDGQEGKVVHISGWSGCLPKGGAGRLFAYKGKFLLEFDPQVGNTSATPLSVINAEEATTTHLFSALHA